MTKTFSAVLVLSILFTACSSKPSVEEIKKKILLEYVCRESAKVSKLEVLEEKEKKTMFGGKGIEFLVTGEVEWPSGCKAFGARVGPGYKESFNKRVFMVKVDNGWQ